MKSKVDLIEKVLIKFILFRRKYKIVISGVKLKESTYINKSLTFKSK